jgi:hypothetical protein
MTDSWFIKIEVELVTGRAFTSALTRDETKELASDFVIEDGPDADLALVRAAYTTLLNRVQKAVGGLVLHDAEGRLWYFDAARIAAFGFQHRLVRDGASTPIKIGFTRE